MQDARTSEGGSHSRSLHNVTSGRLCWAQTTMYTRGRLWPLIMPY